MFFVFFFFDMKVSPAVLVPLQITQNVRLHIAVASNVLGSYCNWLTPVNYKCSFRFSFLSEPFCLRMY